MSSPKPFHEPTLELMHLVLDGAASPAQVRELEQILESSGEALAMYESLRSTVRALESIPVVEVPPTLKGRILQGARERSGASSRVVPFNRRRWILGAVWGLAAASLLGYVVLSHGSGPSDGVSARSAAGTMADLDQRTWPQLSHQSGLDPSGVPVDLRIRRNGERLLLETDLRIGRARALVLKWDPSRFVLLDAQPGQGHFQGKTGEGELVIPPGTTGPVSLVLGPRQGAAGPGAISLTQDGREILQTTVQIR